MISDSSGSAGGLPPWITVVVIVLPLLIWFVTYIWYAVTLAKVFTKLGGESWKAWVPIANEVEIFVRGGLPGWNVVYLFIPLLNIYGIILHIQAVHRINLQFGRGAGLTVLHILSAPIWATVLAFSSGARAQGSAEARVAQAAVQQHASGQVAQAQGAVPPAPSPLTADVPVFEVVNNPVPAVAEPAEAPKLIGNPWAPVPAADGAQAFVPPAVVPPPVVPPVVQPTIATPLIVPPPPVVAVIPEPPVVETPSTVADAMQPAVAPSAAEPAEPAEAAEAAEAVEAPVDDVDPTIVVPAPAPTAAVDDDDDDDEDYETVVVDRRPVVKWSLALDDGRSFALTAMTIALGRKPESTNASTQLLAISDSTRTLSKTHAILDLTDDQWTITDLDSTNGVLTVDDAGVETLVKSGATVQVSGRFILGKVGMRVSFEEGASS